MSPSARIKTASHRRTWRAFWVVVLLCHAPLTLRALTTFWGHDACTADWSRLILLSACNLFFILEIAFAPCLRLVADRRAAVALLLIVAILHTGVIESHLPDVLAMRGAQFWITLTVIGAAACIRRMIRLAAATLCRLIAAISTPPCENFRTYSTCSTRTRKPRPIQSGWRFSPMRAPPVAAC